MSAAGAPDARTPGAERRTPWLVPAGIAIGFAGALCGIGGGIFAGPLLHKANGLALKRATASALVVVLATTLASTATELARGDTALVWPVVVPLALGALAGAQLGFAVAQRIDERALKLLFAVLLSLAGARVLFFTTALGGGFQPGALGTAAIALAIGVGGGFLTPLLGVAGGVLMVPALFLSLGELGFNGARACALAAGAVAAVRSLRLHAKAGSVSFALALPLALGALVGALFGAGAAHQPALVHAGRIGLGVLLLVQGAGFAIELARARGARAARD